MGHRILAATALATALASVATAAAPPLSVYQIVSGEERDVELAKGENAWSLTGRYTMTPALLRALNPKGNLDHAKAGASVRISDRHIAPTRTTDGIVIDIPDRTLYWFEASQLKARFPVAVGRNRRWGTPQGQFHVIERRKDPVWRVPPSIQAEMRASGKTVQTIVKPGPKNPLGKYFVALSAAGVGLHGTNSPSSVGKYATHGCMRMLAPDVERVYHEALEGTPVEIINEPISLARDADGRVWIEVHEDVYRGRKPDMARVREGIEAAGFGDAVDWKLVEQAVKRQWGTAEEVTRVGATVPPAPPIPGPVPAPPPREVPPAELQPVDARPVEPAPADAQPADARPVEPAPAPAQPADARPVEPAPAALHPTQAAPVDRQAAAAPTPLQASLTQP